jgi:hypothetical protein
MLAVYVFYELYFDCRGSWGTPGEFSLTHYMEDVESALAHEGMAPLAGCTPEGLAAELMAHADEWSLAAQVVN